MAIGRYFDESSEHRAVHQRRSSPTINIDGHPSHIVDAVAEIQGSQVYSRTTVSCCCYIYKVLSTAASPLGLRWLGLVAMSVRSSYLRFRLAVLDGRGTPSLHLGWIGNSHHHFLPGPECLVPVLPFCHVFPCARHFVSPHSSFHIAMPKCSQSSLPYSSVCSFINSYRTATP